jgi:hypothetical protein
MSSKKIWVATTILAAVFVIAGVSRAQDRRLSDWPAFTIDYRLNNIDIGGKSGTIDQSYRYTYLGGGSWEMEILDLGIDFEIPGPGQNGAKYRYVRAYGITTVTQSTPGQADKVESFAERDSAQIYAEWATPSHYDKMLAKKNVTLTRRLNDRTEKLALPWDATDLVVIVEEPLPECVSDEKSCSVSQRFPQTYIFSDKLGLVLAVDVSDGEKTYRAFEVTKFRLMP